jgi:hypothetical protein
MCCNKVSRQRKRWAHEIWRRLRAQYGESTLSKTQVKFWHKAFCGGRDAMQNTSPVKAKTRFSAAKMLAAVFWDFKGVLLVDLFHTRRTFNELEI